MRTKRRFRVCSRHKSVSREVRRRRKTLLIVGTRVLGHPLGGQLIEKATPKGSTRVCVDKKFGHCTRKDLRHRL